MPADPLGLVGVGGTVVAVAGQSGQVDAADERDLVVDDHELLVVAVHRAAVRVELALDLRAAHQRVALRAHQPAARLEHRHRRAGPDQHAHRHALGGLAQQLAHRRGLRAARGRTPARGATSRRGRERWAPRIASAISGKAFSPSISTSIELPGRGGAPVDAHRPSLPVAIAPRCPWRRSRRMWWWTIARSSPSPTAASKRSIMRVSLPASLRTHGLRSAHPAAPCRHPGADVPALGLSLTRLG